MCLSSLYLFLLPTISWAMLILDSSDPFAHQLHDELLPGLFFPSPLTPEDPCHPLKREDCLGVEPWSAPSGSSLEAASYSTSTTESRGSEEEQATPSSPAAEETSSASLPRRSRRRVRLCNMSGFFSRIFSRDSCFPRPAMTHEDDAAETFKYIARLGIDLERFQDVGGVDLSSLQPTLERHSLKIGREVGREGSCFFRSLSFLVFGDEEAHWELRLQVLEEMKSNPETYIELFSHSDRASEFESLESYLEAFPEVSFFADEVSVFAVRRTRFSLQGRSFMVRLSVFTDYGSVLEYEPEAEAFAGEVLALKVGLLSNEHYVPLVEADFQGSEESLDQVAEEVEEERVESQAIGEISEGESNTVTVTV